MPRKTDTTPINDPFLDRRTKLLPCQKEMVKWWYQNGESITAISKRFKVNKRLIQFVLFPERQVKNLSDREKRGGWKQYYKKEKGTESTRDHRNYKAKEIKGFLTINQK